jgi:TRAP-type C4-dicarboxylate transport system substrate-binding protein
MKKFIVFITALAFVMPAVFAGGQGDGKSEGANQSGVSGGSKDKITIKLASLVPESTQWGGALNNMAKQWSLATGGDVELVIYHNGVAGTESDVLRKLKLNQIQAAVLSSLGMNQIAPQIMSLSYPFLIRTEDELDNVLDKLKPQFEEQINTNGYTTLAWSKAGWVRIFAKQPVLKPADMKSQKLGSSNEAPAITNAFKQMGYQMIPTGQNEIMMSLNSGRIDAVLQSPVTAGPLQIFGVAKNMTNLNIAPFIGGILINKTAWNRIPEKHRPALLAICRDVETSNNQVVQKLEADAISAMLKNGLVLQNPTDADKQLWYGDVAAAHTGLVKDTFDAAIVARIEEILKEYRSAK